MLDTQTHKYCTHTSHTLASSLTSQVSQLLSRGSALSVRRSQVVHATDVLCLCEFECGREIVAFTCGVLESCLQTATLLGPFGFRLLCGAHLVVESVESMKCVRELSEYVRTQVRRGLVQCECTLKSGKR